MLIGSELQTWTLYFSLPVLAGILPLIYVQHWALLVGALHILSSDSITPEELSTAETLLQEFYNKFADLYGRVLIICTQHNNCLTYIIDPQYACTSGLHSCSACVSSLKALER